jgi:hypothetical protein
MNTAAHLHWYNAGLGGAADTAVQLGSSVAGAVVPVAVGPSVAAILGISTAVAIPVVGVAIAGISIAIEAILHSGCGQTCIVTSQWANQAEQHLQQNIAAWFAIPAPRPKSVQQIALANFDAIWQTLVQQCSQPGLGDAGKNCIADRQAGACKWKATPPSYPDEPATGSCWNWFNGYRDPIANDSNVYDDSVVSTPVLSAVNVLSSATGGAGGINPLLLIGAVLIGGAILLNA